ncbi:MAG: hypothetical protein K6E63_04490 [Lachnospiraceae bacterium]|nr:hypothetical protein [Lachnospiraceae bacterium]
MNSQHKQAVVALFLLGITAMTVVFVYAETVNISKILIEKRTGVRVENQLDEAVKVLEEGVTADCQRISDDVYSLMLLKLKNEEGSTVEALNTGKKAAFYKQYIERLRSVYDVSGEGIAAVLDPMLPKESGASIRVAPDPGPEFFIDYNEASGEIKQCVLRDVVLQYLIGEVVVGEKACTINIGNADVAFSDESVNFYDYSLVAMKGIYITGATSSFVGSMYAGTHEFEEGREAEVIYGEKDPYGGINFLTTQAAVFGDSIITTGDINIKGAFVVFGSEDDKISIYANTINDIENYPSKTEYTVNGDKFLRDGSTEFTNEEHYEEMIRLINSTSGMVNGISSYYSSIEDPSYTGSYAKIISNEDVTLTSDFSGVIITSKNVIIEDGCNVEGLIIAGDRIYVYGNNNIVSGRDIVHALVDEESKSVSATSVSENSIKVSDYIEALPDRGIIILQ